MKKFYISRRNFIKSTTLAGGALLMSDTISGQELKPKPVVSDNLLKGVSDIHIHASPDTKKRSIDELSFARQAYETGYRSIMYKSNDWSCHDRVYLVRKALPDFECFGSVVMNKTHGDKVNVHAAEMALKTTGNHCRCIWMPTTHAVYTMKDAGIPVLDREGKVLPEVLRVMEICAEANIMFATGHSSPAESLVLAKKAKEVGVRKFIVTHSNSLVWKMSHDRIKQCIDLGAWIEYCYLTNLWGPGTGLPDFPKMSNEEFAGFARINPERSFISTDLGQVGMPNPLDGMKACILALLEDGMPQKDIDLMVRTNPAWLVEI